MADGCDDLEEMLRDGEDEIVVAAANFRERAARLRSGAALLAKARQAEKLSDCRGYICVALMLVASMAFIAIVLATRAEDWFATAALSAFAFLAALFLSLACISASPDDGG